MSQYQASIGRSSYEIPYESQEDLPLLQALCKDANRLVNSVIVSNPTISNEFALLLALINTIYEKNHAENSNEEPLEGGENQSKTVESGENSQDENQSHEKPYSKGDILELIAFLQSKI